MERYIFEERYLLAIISSVINSKKIQIPIRKPLWETVFHLADYHNVANLVNYGTMTMGDAIPAVWRGRFFEKYRESVTEADRLRHAERKISRALEENGIHFALLNGSVINRCYPFREMRYMGALEILIQPESLVKLHGLMLDLDFELKPNRGKDGVIYYKIPGTKLIFYDRVPFVGKRMRKYFRKILYSLPLKPNCSFTHEFSMDDYYIYLLCRCIDRYASAGLLLRDMLDLWFWIKRYDEQTNWGYIDRTMRKLKVGTFGGRLEILNYLWFDGGTTDENDIYDAMEAYIMTNGAEGRAESSKLLPLIKEVADFYNRDRRKEWLRKVFTWMFPDTDYMVNIYPFLDKYEFLLPLCWGLRIIRAGWNFFVSVIKKWWRPKRSRMRRKVLYAYIRMRKSRRKKSHDSRGPEAAIAAQDGAETAEIVSETEETEHE